MKKIFFTLTLLLAISQETISQKQELYRVALVKYESGIWWTANERGRNESVKTDEVQIVLDTKSILYIEDGEFVFYPEGKKRKKQRSKEITLQITDRSWGITTVDNFRITIVNNIFVIYINSAKIGYATDEFEYIDWNGKKNRLYISLTKNQKAIDELTPILKGQLESQSKVIPLVKNKWYTINTENRIGALEPHFYRFDDDKITIRAFAYKFNYINRTDFNYKEYNVFIKNTFNGVTSYCGNESYGSYAYAVNNNQCYIDFFIVPNFKMDSIRNDATDKKVFDVSMVMGEQNIFTGQFYATEVPADYNSGPETNNANFYKEYFLKKINKNKNDENEVLKIIKNPAFDMSSYDDIAMYKFKEIPALKDAAENIISLRVKEGTGSIPFNGWMYLGPNKNNIPNGVGVLTNPSPSGFALSPVEIEYKGRWDNGKKNGAFTVLTMYYTSLGGGTIYGRKTKYYNDDIEYEPVKEKSSFTYNPSKNMDDYEIKKTYNNNGLFDRTKTEDITVKCKKTGYSITFSRYYLDKDDPNTWYIDGVGLFGSSYDTYDKALDAAIAKLNCH